MKKFIGLFILVLIASNAYASEYDFTSRFTRLKYNQLGIESHRISFIRDSKLMCKFITLEFNVASISMIKDFGEQNKTSLNPLISLICLYGSNGFSNPDPYEELFWAFWQIVPNLKVHFNLISLEDVRLSIYFGESTDFYSDVIYTETVIGIELLAESVGISLESKVLHTEDVIKYPFVNCSIGLSIVLGFGEYTGF